MTSKFLNYELFALTPVELKQRQSHGNVNYMDLDYVNNPIPQMPRSDFFKHGILLLPKIIAFPMFQLTRIALLSLIICMLALVLSILMAKK